MSGVPTRVDPSPARPRRVLVLTLSEVTLDARVLRQIEFLDRDFDVVVAAVGAPLDAQGIEFVQLPRDGAATLRSRARQAARMGLRLAGRYDRAYWLDDELVEWRAALARAGPFDAVVVNDLFGLPLAFGFDDDVPVVFDAHEHWTSESASWGRLQQLTMRGAHEWIVDHAVPRTSGVMTVSPGIARDYEQRIGAHPSLVTNAPFFRELAPSPVEQPIRLIHVGLADPRRRIEDTIEAVRSLDDRFVLDVVLARDNDYRRRLESIAATSDRIRILPAVPTAELIAFENTYDVGVFLLPARFPNQTHVLPNKLFDYVQARLAVAIGPSPEMAAVVREYDCGVISDSFEMTDFAAALARLTVEDIERMKANADQAAHVLTADNNRDVVLALVRDAIAGTTAS